jgi:hypothetical protein
MMKIIAAKIANELEEICWISDTASVGGFAASDARSQFDGWRYIITNSAAGEAYENDVSGSAVILDASLTTDFTIAGKIAERDTSAPYDWEFKYSATKRNLASKYKGVGMNNLRFFNSDQVEQDFVDALSTRPTLFGDSVRINEKEVNRFGKIPIIPVPLMPTTLNAAGKLGAGSYTDVLLTPKGNLIVGLQREMKMEPERSAADEANYIFFSTKMDLAIENVNACVLTEKMTHGG